MSPKAPSAIINSPLLALPSYSLYTNFDSNNYSPLLTNIRAVGIFVSNKLDSSQVLLQSVPFMDNVWTNIKLNGSDSLLIGGVYHVLHVISIPVLILSVTYSPALTISPIY